MAEMETPRGAPAAARGVAAAEDGGPHKGPHPGDAEVGGDEAGRRGKWASKTEFLLSMAGEIIGLGNVWRFPYLCYRNGGGVFFIPYFIFLFFCGIPVFFLETALGQYTSQGGVTAWRKICPMFEGIGIASQVIVMYLNVYYIVILAWALFYLFNAFSYPLPWSSCDNPWNTEMCHHRPSAFANPHMFNPEDSSWSFLNNNTTPSYYSGDYSDINTTTIFGATIPEEEYWLRRVLRMSDDMSVGTIHWDLALCLLLAWIICYFCIWKGIKSTGKVVYFTATFPYLMLFILFLRGVTLPGAGQGIKFYLKPDISKLADPRIWRDAGTQVFFSYAVCQGVLTALGSYNKYNNNCYRDCLALCCLNSATSIFAGFVVFSGLGYMAHELAVDISEVASSGPGLAFISYPKVLSMLPGSNFWAVLFFFMLLLLGLDSQFVCVESFATAVTDMFPDKLRGRRELLVLAIAVSCFLLGLPLVSEGGALIFSLIDTYGPSGTSLLFIACFETVVIAWVYGADRFYDNIEDMIGYRPLPVLKYCWLFVTPFICGVTMLYDLAVQQPLRVYDYTPSVYTTSMCSVLIIIPLMCIPVYIFVTLVRNPNNMTTPSSDLRQAWPHRPILTMCGINIFKGRERYSPRHNAETDEKLTSEATGV